MDKRFKFTFSILRKHFEDALNNNYDIIRCEDYIEYKRLFTNRKILVNRIDIDFCCKKAKVLAQMFNELGIKGTFFVRLHAKEYNFFSFENYRILKFIRDSGHEIGYHSEIVDESVIWNEPAEECLVRDIDILNRLLNIEVKGVASHNGMTGYNNLDFWKNKKPSDFGLLYEAYGEQPDFNLFNESFYVSDSEWTQWKCYDKGVLIEGDTRPLGDHVKAGHRVIYSLIHSDTYYHDHFYE